MRLAFVFLIACSGQDHMTSDSMQKPPEVVDKKAACEKEHESPCKLDGSRCVFPADCADSTCKVADPARCK